MMDTAVDGTTMISTTLTATLAMKTPPLPWWIPPHIVVVRYHHRRGGRRRTILFRKRILTILIRRMMSMIRGGRSRCGNDHYRGGCRIGWRYHFLHAAAWGLRGLEIRFDVIRAVVRYMCCWLWIPTVFVSVVFMYSSIAAILVDLPLPVGHVTRMIPFWACAIRKRWSGIRISSCFGMTDGIIRNAIDIPLRT